MGVHTPLHLAAVAARKLTCGAQYTAVLLKQEMLACWHYATASLKSLLVASVTCVQRLISCLSLSSIYPILSVAYLLAQRERTTGQSAAHDPSSCAC